jgi:haloacetate dehalogenase
VIAVDLRGYGASQAPEGGPQGEGYSKREMAAELIELMGTLGHERFAVVGHDRGGRVAYRLALDSPNVVTHLALLNILPTLDQFERMGAGPSLGFWPWFLLAQPAPFPERLLSASPGATLAHIFATWAGNPDAVEAETRRAYEQALTPSTIASMCADYRASFHIDRAHDQDDRIAGRRIHPPTLVIIGEDETQLADAGEVWSPWVERLDVARVPGGHFLPEESAAAVASELVSFLARHRP